VAVLEDWSRVLKGRKPIYATRLGSDLKPIPSEDLAHVNLRRDAAGLPPLAYAICLLRMGKGK
jgi:hypothetical protein